MRIVEIFAGGRATDLLFISRPLAKVKTQFFITDFYLPDSYPRAGSSLYPTLPKFILFPTYYDH
jgi:hypothetical protein